MAYQVAPLQKLIEHFERLPGIGRKSAQRLAFHVLNMPKERAEDFARCILEAREKIHKCAVCQSLTDENSAPSAGTKAGTAPPSVWWKTPKDAPAFECTPGVQRGLSCAGWSDLPDGWGIGPGRTR